jgi:hypothetical protein
VAAREEIPVEQLALKLLGGRHFTTSLDLIAMAQRSLVPIGATAPVLGMAKTWVSKFVGQSGFSVDDQAAEPLREEWQRHRRAWEGWKAANPDLVDRLWGACRKSIKLATEK